MTHDLADDDDIFKLVSHYSLPFFRSGKLYLKRLHLQTKSCIEEKYELFRWICDNDHMWFLWVMSKSTCVLDACGDLGNKYCVGWCFCTYLCVWCLISSNCKFIGIPKYMWVCLFRTVQKLSFTQFQLSNWLCISCFKALCHVSE